MWRHPKDIHKDHTLRSSATRGRSKAWNPGSCRSRDNGRRCRRSIKGYRVNQPRKVDVCVRVPLQDRMALRGELIVGETLPGKGRNVTDESLAILHLGRGLAFDGQLVCHQPQCGSKRNVDSDEALDGHGALLVHG